MILNLGPYGKSREKSPPLFTVTDGTYTYQQSVADDGTVNWELALLSGTNATLKFSRVVDYVDVFLVGGGKAGGARSSQTAGTGGKGGSRVTKSGANKVNVFAGTDYAFTVGDSDGSTSIFGFTASSGGGSNGGIGAKISEDRAASAGDDGAYAFGSSTSLLYSGRKYGPGGGGGGYYEGNFNAAGKAGGSTGGGHGGDRNHQSKASASGSANTGGGGGGAGTHVSYGEFYPAGDGGSGIIIIRNAR